MRNRFMGLDLIDRSEEMNSKKGQRFVTSQRIGFKTEFQGKENNKAKWLSGELSHK